MNPFIYATKHEGVKERLARLVACDKCKGSPTAGGDNSATGNTAGGTQQTQGRVGARR